MKRFLAIVSGLVVAFLALTAAYDRLNLWLIRASSGNDTYKMERFFSKAVEDEIPVLGSSRALAHFVPATLGTNVFNYGINGSGVGETLFLLKDLVKRKPFGLILVNVDPWGFGAFDDAKAVFHGTYTLAASSRDVRRRLPPGIVSTSDWLPGVRFQGCLHANLSNLMNARMSVTKRIDRGAVLPMVSWTEEEWAYLDKTLGPTRFVPPSPACRAALDEIVRLVAAHGGRLRVAFVIGPISPPWRRKLANADELRTWALSFADEMSGQPISVIDLFSDTDFATEEFADATHLNYDGAVRFSSELKRILNEMGEFAQEPDSHL